MHALWHLHADASQVTVPLPGGERRRSSLSKPSPSGLSISNELAASPMLDTLGIEADEVSAALNDHERLHDLLSARSASFEQVIHCASDLNAWQT
jgi:hypothetical protein